jgi:hypothetical protein
VAGLNAAFEKVTKAAEKRLDGTVRKGEKQLEAAGKKIQGDATRAVEKALDSAIRNVEKVADELKITDQRDRANLRRGLETIQGAARGARDAAGIAALVPHPVARAAIIGAGAVAGGLAGAALEDARRAATRLGFELDRDQVRLRVLLSSAERDVERIRAARRRAGQGL